MWGGFKDDEAEDERTCESGQMADDVKLLKTVQVLLHNVHHWASQTS